MRNFTRSSICRYLLPAILIAPGAAHASWLAVCSDTPSLKESNLKDGNLASILDANEKTVALLLTNEFRAAENCESRELTISVSDIEWAGFAKPMAGDIKQIDLQGQELNGQFSVSESEIILANKPATPSDTTVVAQTGNPETAAQQRRPPLRAAWFWSPAAWMDMPQKIFENQARLALSRIYITVPVADGHVQQAEQLKHFLQAAHQHDLQVWTVIGDPRSILEQEHPYFLSLVSAYQKFNVGGNEQKLDGLQLDIESYLLPGYQQNPGAWLKKQAAAINAAHFAAPHLPIDVVLPFWLEPLHGDGAKLLSDIEPSVNSITLMNYRTDPDQIREFADKFFTWGSQQQKPVYIALESLTMQEEDRRTYQSANNGELWYFDFKAAPVLLLLRQAKTLPTGNAYSFSRRRKIDGTSVSFFKEPNALLELLPALEKQFIKSSAFAGIALHGIE